MKTVFIGAVQFSGSTLEKIIQMGVRVSGVCTLEHSSNNSDHHDLKPFCDGEKIPCIYAPNINSNETIGWIREKEPDVIFCFGWSRSFKRKLLESANL